MKGWRQARSGADCEDGGGSAVELRHVDAPWGRCVASRVYPGKRGCGLSELLTPRKGARMLIDRGSSSAQGVPGPVAGEVTGGGVPRGRTDPVASSTPVTNDQVEIRPLLG